MAHHDVALEVFPQVRHQNPVLSPGMHERNGAHSVGSLLVGGQPLGLGLIQLSPNVNCGPRPVGGATPRLLSFFSHVFSRSTEAERASCCNLQWLERGPNAPPNLDRTRCLPYEHSQPASREVPMGLRRF